MSLVHWHPKRQRYRWSYVIMDLDGCLCDVRHRQHLVEGPKRDYEAFHALCHLDKPRPAEMAIAKSLLEFSSGHIKLLFVTGRTESWRRMTEAWLDQHCINHYDLEMRPDGDHRPSPLLKLEIVDTYIQNKQRILFAFDDREDVLGAYASLGIPTLLSRPLPEMEDIPNLEVLK